MVEAAAVLEVGILRLLPAAEDLVDGDQPDRGEGLGVLRRDLLVDRPVVVLAGNVLAFFGLEVLQIGFGELARDSIGWDGGTLGNRAREANQEIPDSIFPTLH
jgi:hypothetical protein